MGAHLSPRERVTRAIQHQEVDRVPVDLGSSGVTGISVQAYSRLVEYLGIHERTEELSVIWQLARPSENVLRCLAVDTRGLFGATPDHLRERFLGPDRFVDEWGIEYRRPKNELYFDIAVHPLQGADIDDLERYPWPDATHPERTAGLKERAAALHSANEFALVGTPSGGTSLFERSWYLRGFEQFLMDLILNRELVRCLLDILVDLQLKRWGRFLDEIGSYLDIVVIGDDLAGQMGTLVSPVLYREMIKPYQARYFRSIKQATDAKLFYHSCGSVTPILADLIDIGVDIINPVQTTASNMQPKHLKEAFGNRVVFWGAVDTHELLRTGTPEQVNAAVRELIEDLGQGGGYVMAANHNIQPDVPPENIVALARSTR